MTSTSVAKGVSRAGRPSASFPEGYVAPLMAFIALHGTLKLDQVCEGEDMCVDAPLVF